MAGPADYPFVHLELRTENLARACGFYRDMFGWRVENVHVAERSYLALEPGEGIGGGIVECDEDARTWLPYVEVPDIVAASDRALMLGAEIQLSPREGPAGWRSVLLSPAGEKIALWQPKR